MKIARMVVIIVLALGLAAEVANADFTFGTPLNLGPTVNSSSTDRLPSVSADSLSLYFSSNRPGGYGDFDIWVTELQTIQQMTELVWGTPINLGPPINTPYRDANPSISLDGLTLFFASNRPGGYGSRDLWVTTRSATSEPWSEPVNLGPTVNSSSEDHGPCISADGLELFFTSNRSGGQGDMDTWVTTRTTTSDPWAKPVNLGPGLNSPSLDGVPDISSDGLMLFFRSRRPGTYGSSDIWFSKRATVKDDWGMPVHPGPPVNTTASDSSPNISADGSILYFHSTRAGGLGDYDLWQVALIPIVDLNSDGIVDSADMCTMVDYWGTDEPLCDIGPMPWGDGIVDVQDLIVLAGHLFEEIGGEDLIDIIIERRISASSDDAEEALNAGFTNWNYSSDLEIVDDHIDNGGRQLIGMTFRDIDIAPGEKISNAYIEFVCDETKDGTADAYFLIWGHLTPNPDGFIAPYVISDRPKTEAKVPWEPDLWDARGQRIQTVNIATIIQELIDQEGWAAGNAVEIIIGADPDKPEFTGVRCAESYDGDSSNAPLLHIEIAVP